MSETQVAVEGQFESNDDLDAFSKDFFGQKAVDTEQASPEAEQDETTKTADDVTEAQVTDQEDDLDAEIPQEEEKPKKKTFQDRINELVKQREDEKRASDARLEQLKKEFEEQIASLKPKQAEQKGGEPTPNDQNADGSDKYPLGEFDPAYIRDLTRFTLETERNQAKIADEQARQQREIEASNATLAASWNEKVEASKTNYPDFQEKGKELIDNNFANLDPGYAQYLSTLLMSMDKGPDVLYYLSNNPAEAVTIVNSGAQRATLALGRIEAKFIEADAQKAAAKPKLSKAPPPPPQTRGSAAGHLGVEPDTDDLDAFQKEFFKKAKR